MRPADLPFTEHFQALPCGVRAKYTAGGCRCMLCRAANSRYETARAAARKRGEWNGLVGIEDVVAHVRKLSRQGVGYKSVAAAADVGKTVIFDVLTGRKQQIRVETARRILAVDRGAIADHALVPAGRTLAKLQRLLSEGFSKRELARRLGSKSKTPALQITAPNGKIRARTAVKVERFYRIVMAGA